MIRLSGRVARYEESVGYGFLIGEDGRSYFLHRTAIVGPPLRVGEIVDFTPNEATRWPRARDVRRGLDAWLEALETLITDSEGRRAMGTAARQWVVDRAIPHSTNPADWVQNAGGER